MTKCRIVSGNHINKKKNTYDIVGTVNGSNESICLISIGTHTRPVFGWTQNGAFKRWFNPLDTLISKRG